MLVMLKMDGDREVGIRKEYVESRYCGTTSCFVLGRCGVRERVYAHHCLSKKTELEERRQICVLRVIMKHSHSHSSLLPPVSSSSFSLPLPSR
jgi:hypothetical protein